MRKKKTISAGIFIGRNHLQKGPPSLAVRATAWHFLLTQKMVDLVSIEPASSLNSSSQTQGGLQARPDGWKCRHWEASGGLTVIILQKTAQAFPADDSACSRQKSFSPRCHKTNVF
jgi:hypothetical protein